MAENNLSRLLTKRGPLKAQITRISTWLEKFTVNNEDDYLLLITKEKTLNSVYSKFMETYDKINELTDAEEETDYFIDVQECVDTTVSKLMKLVRNYKPIYDPPSHSDTPLQTADRHVASGQESFMHTRLPDLTLPNFDGNILNWLEFKDSFQSVIVSSNRLANIDKFHYLKGCLSTEAFLTISNIPVSNDNFDIAWSTLCDRYDNTRLIANNHIDRLFNPPALEKNNATSLQYFVDHFISNCNALQQLNLDVPLSDLLISKLILDKLPPYHIREWETAIKGNEVPSLQELLNFVKSQVTITEMTQRAVKSLAVNKSKSNDAKYIDSKKGRNNNEPSSLPTFKCKCCHRTDKHELFSCSVFRSWDLPEREQYVQRNKCCKVCLRADGHSPLCVTYSCKHCHGKHSTLLHNSFNQSATAVQAHSAHLTSNRFQGSSNMLPTVIVKVTQGNGETIDATALLDTGSDCSLITQQFFDKLKLKPSPLKRELVGIASGNVSLHNISSIRIASNTTSWSMELEALVIPKISDFQLPKRPFEIWEWNIPPNISLGNPQFNVPREVDLLLGVDVCSNIICSGTLTATNFPTIQNSQLGWYVYGKLPLPPVNVGQVPSSETNPCMVNHCTTSAFSSSENINQQLTKFWELEAVNNSPPFKKESFCESHYIQNTTRDSSGRYIVKLPFKPNARNLGASKPQAIKRFYSLEKRLANNDELSTQYHSFMKEYEDLGHMELSQHPPSPLDYYIPHHPVFKPSSTSTRLRAVFDASAITSNGTSLNNLLENGPVIQPDLFSILIKFRLNPIAITADISKMYRQILIHPSNRNSQQIMWRSSPQEPLKVYSLKTVTYGTAPASFLAVRTLKQLTLDEGKDFPLASQVINNNMYIDDLICSVPNVKEAQQLVTELQMLMPKGGFQLRKWSSNSKEAIQTLDSSLLEVLQTRTFGDKDYSAVKALGLIWEPISDSLRIETAPLSCFPKSNCTKRNLLSCIASIFDPLGLISPIVARCKFIFQMLWKIELSWDQPIPLAIANMWLPVYDELHIISDISIPRFSCINGKIISYQLHGFCDASEKGYGACLYLRSVNEKNEINISLICAKSKVAPTKIVTIPRLELLAAHLLSILYNKVHKILDLPKLETYLWSDSNIVLAWINRSPITLKSFVANRVADIQEFTESCTWQHVKSKDNPADLLSRGALPNELLNSSIWWNGPFWLRLKYNFWNIETKVDLPDPLPEQRLAFHVTSSESFLTNCLCKFPYLKTVRIMGYVLRFINNVKNHTHGPPTISCSGPLCPKEFSNSLKLCVKLIQAFTFAQEIHALLNNKELSPKSPICAFCPFLDSCNILRIGGRLQNSELTEDSKHQMLLPSNHPFVKNLIMHTHLLLQHAGAQLILGHLRKTFWIISARVTIRSVIRRCNICFRFKAVPATQLMGDLPPSRVNPTYPFLNVSIDYAGPFIVKFGPTRSKTTTKSYLAVFACTITKALHLDLVTELTTKAFLSAFSRFVSRRGLPSSVYSDNGTNFVGANKELQNEFKTIQSIEHQSIIQDSTCHLGINWHFLPPHAPHMGGLHEAAVKSVKHHLKRMTQNVIFNYEELLTLLAQIEAILNSRPLLALTEDPDDLEFLSPGHFLIGRPITSTPSSVIIERISLRSRWHNVQTITSALWRKWSRDYLQSLQRRSKWCKRTPNLQVGTVVLLIEDNTPPLAWITGLIHEVHPGKDGLVRVATVRTPTGLYKRPITKLCPLPSCENDDI